MANKTTGSEARSAQLRAQLPLQLSINQAFTFDNFVEGENADLLGQLKLGATGPVSDGIYIRGEQGAGASHLLQAVCHLAGEQNRSAMYLPLEQLKAFDCGVLEGIEAVDLVCLDHVEAIADSPAWQEALFHLFNALKESGGGMVFAGSHAPAGLGLTLADLVSRLSSCAIYQLHSLRDRDKARLLRQRAQGRGLSLSEDAAQFIINRGDRKVASLLTVLDRLDRHSLAAARRLTIPFIKEVMGW